MSKSLTHIDESARPTMVDVSEKAVTVREALAEAIVVFPPDAWAHLRENGYTTKKGALLDVARVAGVMGVKQTSQWIPFCHPLPIDGCKINIEPSDTEPQLIVQCRVKTTARTGVEMEALTGASAAALTIYDMSKALGHGIEIRQTRLLSKTGGKQDFQANA
ncbi:cyclic pyranopterin monophosphate synthase MoaC [Cerasicoccus fimbriatus]|uniref:cyclic pyranopterin monophosphate synthase MoaC n=1 Tax=Cerasicoccus fimbriatus TaxID=3014554 RepID=UPI0022B57EFA|nr:cyclic pyranopterin monophosphate synthase MoaC [Cerasicoccus sp. TK19100]